jgi:hypothetical protein
MTTISAYTRHFDRKELTAVSGFQMITHSLGAGASSLISNT